jgi:hypothetical protein
MPIKEACPEILRFAQDDNALLRMTHGHPEQSVVILSKATVILSVAKDLSTA